MFNGHFRIQRNQNNLAEVHDGTQALSKLAADTYEELKVKY